MKIIIGTFIILFIGWIVIGSPFIFGDGYGYYHAGKVLSTQGEFTTDKKPEYFNYTGHGVVEINGEFITPYPVGNALLWYPFLKASSLADDSPIYNDYYKAFNGHSLIDGIAISISCIIFASLSIFLIYKSLLLLNFSRKISYFSAVTTFTSSFGLAYTIINASYSHIYEIFLFSWILYLLLKIREKRIKNITINFKDLILIGSLFGMLFLVRPFDALLILPLALFLLTKLKQKLLWVIPGGIPFLLIFLAYNLISYGSIFKTGYSLSDGFIFAFNIDRLIQLLFSDIRGWYIYSPLLILSTIGLLIINKQQKGLKLITLAPFVLLIFGYSFWQNWWGGDSAGQRFLLVLVPLTSIGTASIIYRFKYRTKLMILTISLLTCFSLLIFLLYRFTPTNEIGKNRQDYSYINSYERFGVSDILKYHIEILTSSGSLQEYFQKLQQGLTGGRSLLMIYLGYTKPILKVTQSNNNFKFYLIPTPTREVTNNSIFLDLKTPDGGKSYEISNLNTSILNEIDISCENVCLSPKIDLTEVDLDFTDKGNQSKEYFFSNSSLRISVSDSLKLSIPIREY